MKITKASDIVRDFDESFLAAAFAAFPGTETLAILRELVGGKTQASVLLVDITATRLEAGRQMDATTLSGQFILKIDNVSEWGEPTEADRHRKAVEWDKSGRFSKNHIPILRHSFQAGQMILLVYDIAGLGQLRLSTYQNLGVGTHAECCGIVSSSLLSELNAEYKIESTVSARQSLDDWLGYRLDPIQGKRLSDFAAMRTLGKSAFTEAGRIYLNPLWVCNASILSADRSCTRFIGLQHGDLHAGNLFFDRLNPQRNPFSIIDWALSRECPLFFDQAYFEVSLLLRELSGKPPERLAALLEAVDTETQNEIHVTIPQEHMALAATMRELRNSLTAWQTTNEINRLDPFAQQCLLARIAAGLNWANKPLAESERSLAFTYAAKAATDLMNLFHKSEYEAAIHSLDLTPLAAAAVKHDVTVSGVRDEWNAFWAEVGGFDESEYAYILIAGELNGINGCSSLGFLPWSAVLDLDADSETNGLHAAAAHVLSQRRSLSWFGKEPLPVNFQRGTAWMMANGWPSRKEDVPSSFTAWRRDYQKRIQELSSSIRAGTAPKTVKVLLLPSENVSGATFGRLIEAVDVELGENAEFILVGDSDAELAQHTLLKRRIAISVPVFLSALHDVFGSSETAACPQLPGLSGPVEISRDTLRNWEEDFDVLHSLILETSGSTDLDATNFFRGMPPTWHDLEANLDVPRDIVPELLKTLAAEFKDGHNFTLELWHSPGAGGTTAAFRTAWGLRTSRPTVVLRRFSRLTADRIDAVFQKTQKPVLVIADASDLPSTAREDLFRELGRRNARIGLLYLVRSPRNESESNLQIVDPIKSSAEIARFVDAYTPRCKNDYRRRRLQQIGDITNGSLEVYRSPFFFGLTTYEEEFLTLDRYVGTHLNAITPLARQTILYLALATRFSQKGLSEAFFRRLFQPAISGAIVMEQALGVGPARLIVHGNDRLKFVHPLVAEEALRELLGSSGQSSGQEAWKSSLKDVCVQLIRDVVSIVGPYSDEARELFTQLFIFRDPWTDNPGMGKRQFAPLIEAIATVDGQQHVLTLLTDVCGLEPHYWNHLGRHLIYKTNENFAKAEGFLLKAVELSKEEDALHFHALGMVRRFWIKHTLDEMFKNANVLPNSLSADRILSAVGDLAAAALDAFTNARKLDPDDAHGYITPIQTILMITERMCQADGHTSISQLCVGDTEVARWIQKRMSEAEELLARVQHFRGQKKQSDHERRCEYGLSALYGDFSALISTWERVLDGSATQAWLRRAVANAYLARRGRNWGALQIEELRRIVELAECNLSYNPTSESDLRTWFHAYRFLPEFSYNEAIDRLQAWASRSDSVDAHYYLYILHFLRWKAGGERDEELIQKHLKKCAELSIGRRDASYEWCGLEPQWCPLVNSRELGGWVDQKQFFRDSSKLVFLEGTISSLKRTAGTIRIGNVTRAFFRPPAHLRESEHLNAKVHFVLGFSYERLHAWLVDLGPAPASTPKAVVEGAPPTQLQAGAVGGAAVKVLPGGKGEVKATPVVGDIRAESLKLIKELYEERRRMHKPLTMAVIGSKLRDRFPGSIPVYERLGFSSLRAFVASWDQMRIKGYGGHIVVEVGE